MLLVVREDLIIVLIICDHVFFLLLKFNDSALFGNEAIFDYLINVFSLTYVSFIEGWTDSNFLLRLLQSIRVIILILMMGVPPSCNLQSTLALTRRASLLSSFLLLRNNGSACNVV